MWTADILSFTAESMTPDQAWHVLKSWLSSATIASGLDTGSLAAAAGIDRKRIARCLSRRRDEVLTEAELGSIAAVTGYLADTLAVAASRMPGVPTHRSSGKPEPGKTNPLPAFEESAVDRSPWQEAVLSHCRCHIRVVGAGHLPSAWAVAQAHASHPIAQSSIERFLASVPRFQWLDGSKTWFWFGYAPDSNHVIDMAVEILRAAGRPLPIEVVYGGVVRWHPTPGDEPEAVTVSLPMIAFTQLLERYIGVALKAGMFQLTAESEGIRWVGEAAELVVHELRARGGIASERELHATLVRSQLIGSGTLFDALQHSPLICQLDTGLYGLRGQPLPANRLLEALALAHASPDAVEVTLSSDGGISWAGSFRSSFKDGLAMPTRAAALLSEGPYELPDGRRLRVVLGDNPLLELPKTLARDGKSSNKPFAITLWPQEKKAEFVFLETRQRVT